MVRRDHGRTLARDVLDALAVVREQDPEERLDQLQQRGAQVTGL
jgi:hypothetical protein